MQLFRIFATLAAALACFGARVDCSQGRAQTRSDAPQNLATFLNDCPHGVASASKANAPWAAPIPLLDDVAQPMVPLLTLVLTAPRSAKTAHAPQRAHDLRTSGVSPPAFI